jgi:site-specific recombinase XerD
VTASTADGVRPGDVDAFLQREEASGLARSTLQRRRSTLRQFYDWLTRNGLADANPARHGQVRQPMGHSPATTSGADTLSRAEAESLVRSIDGGTATGRRNRAMVLLMLHCALRRSEIVRVNIGDVRLVGRHAILDIRGPYEQSDAPRVPDVAIRGNHPPDETLSGRSKVPPHVYRHVEAVRMDVGSRAGALFRSYSNRNRGARITGDAVYHVVRDAGKGAGLEDVSPNTLRKTALQLAVDAGATGDQVRAHGRYAAAGPFATETQRENRLGDNAADYIQIGTDLSS